MKLIFKTICLSLLTTVMLSSCTSEGKKKVKEVHKNTKPKHLQNSKRPADAITYQEFAAMITQYETHQQKVLEPYVNKKFGYNEGDTQSNWFSIEELKQYIAYVERLSKEKEIELTGIRIFSAAYPNNDQGDDYKGRQSLIFTPTAKIKGKIDVSFEPLKSTKGNPLPMLEYLEKFKKESRINRASFLSNVYTQQEFSSALNRASLNPPYH